MSQWLRQNTAVVITFGPVVDKGDGVTLETGAAIITGFDHAATGIFLSKNGGPAAVRHAPVTATTYDAHGFYKVWLDATDTNTLGTLMVMHSDPATYLEVWRVFMVVPANVWDSLFGADRLNVCVAEEDNLDFGALKKASLNAATPASVQNIPANGSGFTALGDARLANLDAAVSSRLAPGGTLARVTLVDRVTLADRLTLGDRVTLVDLVTSVSSGPWPSAASIADAVWDELLVAHALAGSAGKTLSTRTTLGSGSVHWPYTVTNEITGLPVADVKVWVTTDIAGLNIIVSGYTNAFGIVTFDLDPGTYYIWRQKSGWDCANPDTEVVS